MEEDFVKYFPEPEKTEEFESNVRFQIQNVQGYMSCFDYESALIKANCVVKAIEELIAYTQK